MKQLTLSKADQKRIGALVDLFESRRSELSMLVESLRVRIQETKPLFALIHSLKWRLKDPTHLRDKLERKAREAAQKGQLFDITPENLFTKVNDLGGLRILHLYTRQMGDINKLLLSALEEGQYNLVEGPIAKTWDNETRDYFNELGIRTEDSGSLYTSVHYIIESNSKTKFTCELQVRTLAEELWGEVSHSFNYPHPAQSIACAEQIKVLARATSTCSRLVDAVFRSLEEHRKIVSPNGSGDVRKRKRGGSKSGVKERNGKKTER